MVYLLSLIRVLNLLRRVTLACRVGRVAMTHARDDHAGSGADQRVCTERLRGQDLVGTSLPFGYPCLTDIIIRVRGTESYAEC